MSHSHLPVKHLLKQLEIYRSTRRNRDIRPVWLTDFISRVSELFDPADEVARVGFECRLTEEAWDVLLFLGSTEIVGGPGDGQIRQANFRFDLLTLIGHFTTIERIEWTALPESGSENADPRPSFVEIAGRVNQEPVRLLIYSAPPAGVGPGIRTHHNGHSEPV